VFLPCSRQAAVDPESPMDAQILLGAGIVLLAGFLQGLFAVPMKFARRWNYENIWLVFAFTGLVLFPWLLTFATVPHLGEIYHSTPGKTIAAVVGFGVCWGAGAALTGLGLNMLGIGLGLAIILGLSASIGSLVPLLVLTPEKLATSQGHLYLIGTAVMLAGIAVASRAGSLRDKAGKPSPLPRRHGQRFFPRRSARRYLRGTAFLSLELQLRFRNRGSPPGPPSGCLPGLDIQRSRRSRDHRRIPRKLSLLRLSLAQEFHSGKVLDS